MVQQIKVIRHSERLDYARPYYWCICFGYLSQDPPLSKRGYELVLEKAEDLLAEAFVPDRIYTSPYLRTMTTATIIHEHYPDSSLAIDAGLSEYQNIQAHRTSLCPNGIVSEWSWPETREQMTKRAIETINNIIERHPNEDILIVTHRPLIKMYAKYLGQDLSDVPYLSGISFTR